MKTAPIVFLDFDGVTHPAVCGTEDLFTCLPLIEAVLRRHPRVEIVISSSWREIHPLRELREFFAEDIASRVVDATPVVTRYDRDWYPVLISEFARQREVEAWLQQSRTMGHPWIAIDDRSWWFEPECPHLLVTRGSIGFTATDADRLHQMILEKSS